MQEATPPATLSDNEAGNSGEAAASGGEKDATIFEEEAKSSGGLLLPCKTIGLNSRFMRHEIAT